MKLANKKIPFEVELDLSHGVVLDFMKRIEDNGLLDRQAKVQKELAELTESGKDENRRRLVLRERIDLAAQILAEAEASSVLLAKRKVEKMEPGELLWIDIELQKHVRKAMTIPFA